MALKFVFHVGTHFSEGPSHEMAVVVKRVLETRGHKVKIVALPDRLCFKTLTALVEKASSERRQAAALSFLRKRAEYFSRLHELGGSDAHVVDFHNSAPHHFYPVERLARLEDHGLSVHGPGDRLGSPLSFVLSENASTKRLVGELELPAVLEPVPESELAVREAAEDAIGRPPHGLADVALDYTNQKHLSYSPELSRRAGFMTQAFAEKIAGELEKAAQNPAALPKDPRQVVSERHMMELLRMRPYLVKPDPEGHISRQVALLAQEKLKRVGLQREAAVQGNVREAEKLAKEIRALDVDIIKFEVSERHGLDRLKEFCRKAHTTPQQLIAKYGLTAHFFKPAK